MTLKLGVNQFIHHKETIMKNKTKYRLFKLLQWSLRLGLVMTVLGFAVSGIIIALDLSPFRDPDPFWHPAIILGLYIGTYGLYLFGGAFVLFLIKGLAFSVHIHRTTIEQSVDSFGKKITVMGNALLPVMGLVAREMVLGWANSDNSEEVEQDSFGYLWSESQGHLFTDKYHY